MTMSKLVFVFVVALAIAFAGVAVADCGHCSAAKGHAVCKGECTAYDKSAVTTFEGKVVSMDKETCKGCGMTHVDLVVKTKDAKMKVRLGPAWYIDKQEDLLKKDDVVEIIASKVKHGDDSIFIAGKIMKGDDVLMLRDKDGVPMWRGWRHGKV